MVSDVYVHVGLPKTGTSYLQRTLWLSKPRLAEAGVLVPGERHAFQRRAVWDLLGRRLRGGRQRRVAGSWRALVRQVEDWPGDRVLVTDESLVHARPAHARRLVRTLGPAQVHVVITVRDLARVICSMWQQDVSKGKTWSWPDFVAAVRDPEHAPATAGFGFWLRYDLRKVLRVWEAVVPPERIHVVVVPVEGSGPVELLDRFATATGLDPAWLTPAPERVNTSVGVAETELLRRLNAGLAHQLSESQYLNLVQRVVKPALRRQPQHARITLPSSERKWLEEHTRALMEMLKNSPYDVVGPLDDLMPQPHRDVDEPAGITDHDIAEVAVTALTGTLARYAERRGGKGPGKGPGKAPGKAPGKGPGTGPGAGPGKRPAREDGVDARTRLSSARRALGFRARVAGLERADRSRLLARAAGLYFRRVSRDPQHPRRRT